MLVLHSQSALFALPVPPKYFGTMVHWKSGLPVFNHASVDTRVTQRGVMYLSMYCPTPTPPEHNRGIYT